MQNSGTFLQDKEEDKIIEINYDALIDLSQKDFSSTEHLSLDVEPSEEELDEKNAIVFYCRDCKKMVEVRRMDRSKKRKKNVYFECTECEGKNVLYGTNRGVGQYFHLSS